MRFASNWRVVSDWRKSRRSNPSGNCVEVAVVDVEPELSRVVWSSIMGEGVLGRHETLARPGHKEDAGRLYLIRDSKSPGGPFLRFTPDEWKAFVGGVKDGDFDRMGT